ncbi:MAG: hypothetical protein JNK63_03570 [Chthonomonas sp.]|nr:hypothetical protein [Chthonomonas sp.]
MNKLTLTALGALLIGSLAHAQGVFYVSAVGATNGSVINGGAVAGAGPITKYVTDDINIDPMWAGQPIRYIAWNTVNTGGAAISCRPRYRMHQADGTTVGPTGINDPATLGPGFSFAAISFVPGNNYYAFAPTVANNVLVPASGKFWAGWVYDNNANTTGATDADLNLMALGKAVANSGFFAPSTDAIYTTNTPGSWFQAIVAGNGVQSLLPAGDTLDMDFGLMSQNYNFNMTMNDVVSPAYAKTINITVAAGNVILAGYYIFTYAAAGPNVGALAIRCPARLPIGASNPVTITMDGGQFLKRKFDVTIPAAPNDAPVAIVVPDVALTNGDCDGSGEVDAADIDQVIADFGAVISAETDAAANSDCDINGEVDAADIDIVIANFGAVDDV